MRKHLSALTQPTPTPVKNQESTMQNHTNTSTQGETPDAIVKLNPNDIQPRDWQFLREWANKRNVSIEVLLKRILIAAIKAQLGQLYADDTAEI